MSTLNDALIEELAKYKLQAQSWKESYDKLEKLHVEVVHKLQSSEAKLERVRGLTVEEIADICVKAQQYRESVGSGNPWEHDFGVFIHRLLTERMEGK